MAEEEVKSTEAVVEAPVAEVKAEVPAKFKDLVEKIDTLTVLELADLVKVLEDRYGVSAAAPVAMVAAGAAAGAAAEPVEEKTIFDVVIANAGDKKIQVI